MLKSKKTFRDSAHSYGQTKELLLQGQLNVVEGGTALFSFGYELDLEGKNDAADAVYRQTIELLESISDSQCSISKLLGLANVSFLHGKNLFELGRFELATASFHRCVEILDSFLLLDASTAIVEKLASSLTWLGRSQRKSGKIQDASKTYIRAVGVWRVLDRMITVGPQSHDIKISLAIAMLGQSKVLARQGKVRQADSLRQEAEGILKPYLNKIAENS